MNVTERFIDRIEYLLKHEYTLNIGILESFADYTGVIVSGDAKLKEQHELYLKQIKTEGIR